MLIPLSSLPAVNASLNATSAVFLIAGYSFIRRGKITAHRICMLTAFFSSTAFLVFYLYFHFHAGLIRFGGQGWIRPVYFTLLTSHTILAVVIVPLVLITLTRALRERFDRHRAIARWTLPVWLYVSVTGVIIYWLLYLAYTPIGAPA
jgi:putative membrane protein